MANDQISLSTVVVLVIITGLVYKYVISSPASPPPGGARAPQSREAVQRSREAAVERIQQMFPQTDRRALLWDLQRSGGSIQATTERILAGRLETVRMRGGVSGDVADM
jgi:coupling of ubiquitin conjugation to ER degradation protein 1